MTFKNLKQRLLQYAYALKWSVTSCWRWTDFVLFQCKTRKFQGSDATCRGASRYQVYWYGSCKALTAKWFIKPETTLKVRNIHQTKKHFCLNATWYHLSNSITWLQLLNTVIMEWLSIFQNHYHFQNSIAVIVYCISCMSDGVLGKYSAGC